MRDAVLAVIPPTLSEDALDELEIKPVRRAPVQKWKSQEGETAPRLEEIVEYRLERRAQRTLLSFFKHPYDSARDREHFAHFLESIVESQSVAVHKIAHELEMLLNAPQMIAIGGYQRMSRRSAWLDSFLADEPAWEERLRAWIAKLHLTDAV